MDAAFPDLTADANGPVLLAERTGDGLTVRVWCRYCDTHHVHGDPTTVEGGTRNRVAHCHVDDSPYRKMGYTLDVVDAIPRPTERRKPRDVGNRRLHGWGPKR